MDLQKSGVFACLRIESGEDVVQHVNDKKSDAAADPGSGQRLVPWQFASGRSEIPYTVRLAPELLERIERIARARGIAPRKLVRAVLAERFGGERGVPDGAANETNQYRTLDQILFDLTRTRLTLQHLLDNQVGSEITDQIRQTAQAEAERYMQRLRRTTI